jgi:hypothetical protein
MSVRQVWSPPPARHELIDAINVIVRSVALGAKELERKWGYGRLPLIAGVELAEKFDRQKVLYRQAIDSDDLDGVRQHAAAMQRAWGALEAGALANGHQPTPPDQWEFLLPDGKLVVLVRDNAQRDQADLKGREAQVWSLDEIVSVITHHPLLAAVKDTFPGARLLPLSESLPSGGLHQDALDDLPF